MAADLQFKEGVCNLKHQNVWMSVVMDNKYAFYCAAHAIVFIVILQSLETGRYRGIFLWLGFLSTVGWPKISEG